MNPNSKILFAVITLSLIVFSLKMRAIVLNDDQTPPGYAAPKTIAAFNAEVDRAYVKAMSDLENEELGKKTKALSSKAHPWVVKLSIPVVKAVSLKHGKFSRTVAFKPGTSSRLNRKNGNTILVSHRRYHSKKTPKSTI